MESLTLELESGEVVELDVRELTTIPTDPDELRLAASRAPASLAFVAAQAERWLRRVRMEEWDLQALEGQTYLVYRQWYVEQAVTPTEGMIRSRVDQDQKVRDARIALAATKEFYGVLRGLRDAVDHRCSLIRTLISRPEH